MGSPNDPFADPGESMAPDAPDSDDFEYEFEGQDSTAPPSGWYRSAIKDVRKATGKQSGKPMFEWDVVILSSATGDEDHQGWVDTIYTSLSPKAEWKLEETLYAVGIMTEDQMGQSMKIKFKRGQVVGKLVMALVEETEFNNRKRQQITQLQPPQEGAGTDAPEIPGSDIPF